MKPAAWKDEYTIRNAAAALNSSSSSPLKQLATQLWIQMNLSGWNSVDSDVTIGSLDDNKVNLTFNAQFNFNVE